VAAAPSITITSPPLGQDIHDLHPTITVEYAPGCQ
jgi:hypothetical protein